MITLELEIQEVNTILSGLGKLPAEMSMELILKIRAEAERQLKELDESSESPQQKASLVVFYDMLHMPRVEDDLPKDISSLQT